MKILMIILTTILFLSCNRPTTLQYQNSANSIDENGMLYEISVNYKYILVTDSNIFYIETGNVTNADITEIKKLK